MGDYNDSCDIGPTNTGWIDGYVEQDDVVGFADLVVYTFNYDFHPLQGERVSGDGDYPIKPKPLVGDLIVSAEIPSSFTAGQEFDAVINLNNPAEVKCLSLTFDYDTELLEAVSIETGNMFEDRSAFLIDRIGEKAINLDGTILGADAVFSQGEVARIRFRAKESGSFEFAQPIMDLRDRQNQALDVAFSNVFDSPSSVLPTAFSLKQNYPNPFNPATTIEFAMPTMSEWRIDVFNIVGQRVKTFTGTDDAGVVTVVWDGSDEYGSKVATGIYFYKATALNNGFVQTKKMVLTK